MSLKCFFFKYKLPFYGLCRKQLILNEKKSPPTLPAHKNTIQHIHHKIYYFLMYINIHTINTFPSNVFHSAFNLLFETLFQQEINISESSSCLFLDSMLTWTNLFRFVRSRPRFLRGVATRHCISRGQAVHWGIALLNWWICDVVWGRSWCLMTKHKVRTSYMN